MAAPAECHLCGRTCPLGGVPDDVGRPVHYLCRGMRRTELAEQARNTAKTVARFGRPSPPLLRSEVATDRDCTPDPSSSLTFS